MNTGAPQAALLEVRDLEITFFSDRGALTAVDGISFSIGAGETLGLVGESGCGKSVTGAALLKLLPRGAKAGGSICYAGSEVTQLSGQALQRFRGKEVGMVFQDPLSALNPVLSIGEQMVETLKAHEVVSSQSARLRAQEVLDAVGMPDPSRVLSAYPHELSGGMRQRALIAMAILLRPKLLIADEPTTALDVTVQAQIIELLQRLRAEQRLAMILISHDLGVVAQLADIVAVMYAGRFVETGDMRAVFKHPRHPYTAGLLRSIPSLTRGADLSQGIPGSVPDPLHLPLGCAFHPRCPRAIDQCPTVIPSLIAQGITRFACHNPEPGS